MYFQNLETIEINEQLKRYDSKSDINKNDSEFQNLIAKIKERQEPIELKKATQLLIKFGNVRYEKMNSEQNNQRKQWFPKIILQYYEKALEMGDTFFDTTELKKKISVLKQQ
jgi:hypothetical protein